MKEYVVDASVAVKWFIPEVHSIAASRLMDSEINLHAPDFFAAEIGNILWKKIRRREIEVARASEIVNTVQAFDIEIHPSAELLPVALNFAVAFGHPIYDCLYLAVAVAQNCPVVTADKRFAAAAAPTHSRYILWVEDAL